MNNCRDEELLAAWIEGHLPPASMHEVLLHCIACARCQLLVLNTWSSLICAGSELQPGHTAVDGERFSEPEDC
jgi:hypothetical protein